MKVPTSSFLHTSPPATSSPQSWKWRRAVVLYGCETWSLTLREEHRLRVFENRVLRRIFGPKRDEVAGEWIKLHKEQLRDLYSSPCIYCSSRGGLDGRGM
jgi:hypothetical protein